MYNLSQKIGTRFLFFFYKMDSLYEQLPFNPSWFLVGSSPHWSIAPYSFGNLEGQKVERRKKTKIENSGRVLIKGVFGTQWNSKKLE
jgi:hypothetical protein